MKLKQLVLQPWKSKEFLLFTCIYQTSCYAVEQFVCQVVAISPKFALTMATFY